MEVVTEVKDVDLAAIVTLDMTTVTAAVAAATITATVVAVTVSQN